MHRKLSLSVLGVLVGAAILGVAVHGAITEAAGPNLLTNGDFSNGMTGWLPDDPQYTQAAVDQGAGVITSSYPGDGSSFYGIEQCIPIQGGQDYRLEADVFVEVGEPAYGTAQVFVTYASGPQCNTGYLGGNYVSYDNANRDSWQHLVLDSTAPAAAQGVLIELVPTKQQAPSPADPVTARFDNVTFSLQDQGTPTPTPPAAEPRSIDLCSQIESNGDADTEQAMWLYAVYAGGQQSHFLVLDLLATEGPAGVACGTIDLETYGVANETVFSISQLVEPTWNDAAGYPSHAAGGGFVSGATANFTYPLGYGANFTVTFANKEGVAAPPAEERNIQICSQIDPNGDADTEGNQRTYGLYVQGQQQPAVTVYLDPVEGQPADCQSVEIDALPIGNETAFSVVELDLPGWQDSAGYPKHDVGAGFVTGSTANFNYPPGSGSHFFVKFASKEAVVAPPADPTPDPTGTPTPPPPTGTPTPPPSTPTPPPPTGTPTPPPSTPTPPAPTGTPTPPPPPAGTPGDPTETPDDPTETPDDPTETPGDPIGTPDDPTGTPGTGDAEGTEPGGDQPGEPTSQPEGTATPAEEAVEGSTPAPPSAGTGMTSPPSGNQAIGAVAALLMAVGGLGIAGLVSRRRR